MGDGTEGQVHGGDVAKAGALPRGQRRGGAEQRDGGERPGTGVRCLLVSISMVRRADQTYCLERGWTLVFCPKRGVGSACYEIVFKLVVTVLWALVGNSLPSPAQHQPCRDLGPDSQGTWWEGTGTAPPSPLSSARLVLCSWSGLEPRPKPFPVDVSQPDGQGRGTAPRSRTLRLPARYPRMEPRMTGTGTRSGAQRCGGHRAAPEHRGLRPHPDPPSRGAPPPHRCLQWGVGPGGDTEGSTTTHSLVVHVGQDPGHQLHQEDDQQQAEVLGGRRDDGHPGIGPGKRCPEAVGAGGSGKRGEGKGVLPRPR